jgi:hypothetical protein
VHRKSHALPSRNAALTKRRRSRYDACQAI